jgi:diadenosine tetraphosphatase ApaH/serine/threonine PP2A family protein phosphatase
MRILVLSDIHGNLPALQAVLLDASPVDQIWCLGDVVGYGPYPNECIQTLSKLPNLICLLGNHDAAVVGIIPLHTFNQDARSSVQWTSAALTNLNRSWLESLPEIEVIDQFTLAHGSPRNPVWEYLLDPGAASINFDYFETDFALVGHTHLPIQFNYSSPHRPARWSVPTPNQENLLKPRAIFNPGSVGQPRDHDPRAAYAMLDTDQLTWQSRRVVYDVQTVQQKILDVNLPERHALRLIEGW